MKGRVNSEISSLTGAKKYYNPAVPLMPTRGFSSESVPIDSSVKISIFTAELNMYTALFSVANLNILFINHLFKLYYSLKSTLLGAWLL